MTRDDLIQRYVADVIKLLPRRQRADVARELRALLTDEIDGADEAGADADEAGTRAVLRRFGHPAEVAARYSSPPALIDPVDTRRFLTLAVGGAALIHFGAILEALMTPAREVRAAADAAGPVAAAWVGLLFVGFALAAWVRRRRTGPPEWKPAPAPTDRINRPGRIAAVVFFALSTAVLVDPAAVIRLVTGGRAAQPAYDAFAYDDDFLRVRGPVLLALMVLGIGIQSWLAWAGRWRTSISAVDSVHSVVVCAALVWAISAGPIFSAAPTDEPVRGVCALIVLGAIIDLAVRARRLSVVHALRP